MEIANHQPGGITPESQQLPIQNEMPTPNDPPWKSWPAIVVWGVSVFLILLMPNIFLFPYLASEGVLGLGREAVLEFIRSDQLAIILQLSAIFPAHLLTIAAAWFVVTKANRFSFRDTLGWDMNGFKLWHAAAIFVGFYALAITLTALLPPVENDFERLIRSSRTAVYLVALFATLTAPVVEEVVYRGLLYSAFQRAVGVVMSVVLVTILFTIVHVPQYSKGGIVDYATVITLLLLSLTLTLVRVKTGNLLPCIVLHTVINGAQSLLLIAEPYLPTPAPEGLEPTAASAIFRLLSQ